ncbi:hypothetical protein FEM48_ZijujUnG0085400 [Ziziphus jujuba var. spinosa]|uniref:Peroxisomal nicotinamide adenine dinucleotide carrier-like n=1 Tax=Ziziphus jujuba var. spinosa TaxID=714518 RepID=A0A978U8M2_ZIZJJ|nr:hypothetical protein FEM48_ZijujUnG0085400 [Ziziphus jujuba var. spinosa]
MSNAVANGVNTRQQTERSAKKGLAKQPSNSSGSNNTLVQILHVIRTEGWGGLYSGLKPSLLGTAASQGIYYYFYQVFKNKAEAVAAARRDKGHGDGTVGMISWLVVAAIAGSLNVLLTNPIWVLVTRMQTHTQAERKILEERKEDLLREASESSLRNSTLQDKLAELDSLKPRPYGTLHAWNENKWIKEFQVREVFSEAGITGFWKGIIPTLIMVCNPSIQFMIYETSLKHLRAKRAANKWGSKRVTALEVSYLLKMFDNVRKYVTVLFATKSRLQAKQEIGGNITLRYSGTLDAIVKMIRHEGLPGFYKGMSTKIVQSVFAASVLFMVKEEIIKAYMLLEHKHRKLRLNFQK